MPLAAGHWRGDWAWYRWHWYPLTQFIASGDVRKRQSIPSRARRSRIRCRRAAYSASGKAGSGSTVLVK